MSATVPVKRNAAEKPASERNAAENPAPEKSERSKKEAERKAAQRLEEKEDTQTAVEIYWPLYQLALGSEPDGPCSLGAYHRRNLPSLLREAAQGEVSRFRWACKWWFEFSDFGKRATYSVGGFASCFPECLAKGEKMRQSKEGGRKHDTQ